MICGGVVSCPRNCMVASTLDRTWLELMAGHGSMRLPCQKNLAWHAHSFYRNCIAAAVVGD